MTIPAATVVAACITAAAGLTYVWLNNRADYKRLVREQSAVTTQATDRLVDQLQEERHEIKQSLHDAHKKIETLGYRQRYWEDYVNELRSHIEQKAPPPPPPYPAGLLRINMETQP